MKNKIINCICIFSIFLIISNCAVNPSTGKNEFVIMSEKEEDEIGKREHPKIIKVLVECIKMKNYKII